MQKYQGKEIYKKMKDVKESLLDACRIIDNALDVCEATLSMMIESLDEERDINVLCGVNDQLYKIKEAASTIKDLAREEVASA